MSPTHPAPLKTLAAAAVQATVITAFFAPTVLLLHALLDFDLLDYERALWVSPQLAWIGGFYALALALCWLWEARRGSAEVEAGRQGERRDDH